MNGLSFDDLENMSFGMAIDVCVETLEMKNPDAQNGSVRKASQSDFDSF